MVKGCAAPLAPLLKIWSEVGHLGHLQDLKGVVEKFVVGFVSNSINRKGNVKICAVWSILHWWSWISVKNKKRDHSFSLSYCVRKRVSWNFSKTGWSTSHSTRKPRQLSLARSVHARAEIHAWDSGRLRVGSRWANEDLQVPARCELTFGCQGDTESFSSHGVPCIVCKVCPCHDGLFLAVGRCSGWFNHWTRPCLASMPAVLATQQTDDWLFVRRPFQGMSWRT